MLRLVSAAVVAAVVVHTAPAPLTLASDLPIRSEPLPVDKPSQRPGKPVAGKPGKPSKPARSRPIPPAVG